MIHGLSVIGSGFRLRPLLHLSFYTVQSLGYCPHARTVLCLSSLRLGSEAEADCGCCSTICDRLLPRQLDLLELTKLDRAENVKQHKQMRPNCAATCRVDRQRETM